MSLPLRKLRSKREAQHWPLTVGDVALHLGLSASYVRHICLIGICQPATDSRRRRLFMPADVECIERYRKTLHGRK
jgi:DNA-binding transcriptional MerR regulator